MFHASRMADCRQPISSRPALPRCATAVASALFLMAHAGVHAQSANVTLPEVVVSASGFEQDIKKAPASITVVSREVLETKRATSLAEALADVEGVDVGNDVGKTGGMNISIRGMPSDYTLVLVDGRRQNAAGNVTPNGFGETSTSFLPPISAIERIEVIRGPMATLYGSDAMGGVINIITRKIGKRWSGSTTLNYSKPSDGDRGDTRRETNAYDFIGEKFAHIGVTRMGPDLSNLGRRLDALHGVMEAVQGLTHVTTGIFDGTAYKARCSGLQDGIRAALGVITEAVLQVCRHRQRGGVDDAARIAQGFLQAHGAFGIGAPQRERQAGTGGGQRLETQAGEQLGGAGIPRVGDDERTFALV